MAEMLLKFENSLKFTDIVDVLGSPADGDLSTAEVSNTSEIAQTRVTGIFVPLVKVNNIKLEWNEIESFELDGSHILPHLELRFVDGMGFVRSIDQPGADNLVRVQILPPFDDAYKKINLNFYITHYYEHDNRITLSAIYMAEGIYNNMLRSFGKISTYDFAVQVARSLKLGFVSDVSGSNDARYIYCANSTLIDALSTEVDHGGGSQEIFSMWVDFWNNVCFQNVFAQYNTVQDTLPEVWSTLTYLPQVDADATPPKPMKLERMITNHPQFRSSELHVRNYRTILNTGSNASSGTDKSIDIWNYGSDSLTNMLIMDGDVKNDAFGQYIYAGEEYSDYAYLEQGYCVDAFFQKMNAQQIEVEICSPMLGIMRGDKINFYWYDANDMLQYAKESSNENIHTNIPGENTDNVPKEQFTINKTISGQYLIIGTRLKYIKYENRWTNTLTMVRPASQVFKYNEEDVDNNNKK